MAIGDIFKKDGKKEAIKKAATKPVKKTAAAVETAKAETKKSAKKSGMAVRVLKHAQITEKASKLAEGNQYIFQVDKGANKKEIARAVENYYKVEVTGVNVVNIPAKRRRMGKGIAFRPGLRKAIVKIKTGQKIEILPR